MLTELRLRNIKCFRQLDLRLARFTLLAGLNGMGKSTVLQSLLLLRQSWRAGDLQQERLLLNGDLVELGNGQDVLQDNADKDQICVGINLRFKNKSEKQCDFVFDYDLKANQLQAHGSSSGVREFLRIAEQAGMPLFGDNFHYICAERWGPRKMLPLSESHVREKNMGAHGEYALHFLFEYGHKLELEKSDPRFYPGRGRLLYEQVDAWLQEISPGSHIYLEPVLRADSILGGFEFERKGDVNTRPFRATNVGFGLSYVLPVLLMLLATPTAGLVLLENPEAHLHPRGQTRLGELAARAAAAGVQVPLETHSDHVLDGARICVREGVLKPEKTAFHYFERDGSEARAVSPKIDLDGRLDQWPSGFFDQHDENLAQLVAPKKPG